VVDCFDNGSSRQAVRDAAAAGRLPCLHAGLEAEYAEVIWNEDYRVPGDAGAGGVDVCDYPLARNLVLLATAVAAEELIRFATSGEKRSRTLTLGDFAIREVAGAAHL
jgi:hypothetical protein